MQVNVCKYNGAWCIYDWRNVRFLCRDGVLRIVCCEMLDNGYSREDIVLYNSYREAVGVLKKYCKVKFKYRRDSSFIFSIK